MAGVFSKQRFGFASETTIEELKNVSKNPNTVKSTSFWLNVWETWCKQKNIVNKIEEKELEKLKLNKLLETFYAEVRNKTGDDHQPDSLRVMIAALDKHLRIQVFHHKRYGVPLFQASFRGESSGASPIRYGQTSK